MADPIYKVVGTSNESISKAIGRAISKAIKEAGYPELAGARVLHVGPAGPAASPEEKQRRSARHAGEW
jgi:hypothetical protein